MTIPGFVVAATGLPLPPGHVVCEAFSPRSPARVRASSKPSFTRRAGIHVRRLARVSRNVKPAVDVDRLAGHITRIVAGQEGHYRRDVLLGVTDATNRDHGSGLLGVTG